MTSLEDESEWRDHGYLLKKLGPPWVDLGEKNGIGFLSKFLGEFPVDRGFTDPVPGEIATENWFKTGTEVWGVSFFQNLPDWGDDSFCDICS